MKKTLFLNNTITKLFLVLIVSMFFCTTAKAAEMSVWGDEPGTMILLGIGLAVLGGVAVVLRLRSMSISSPQSAGIGIMGYTMPGLLVRFLRRRYHQLRPLVDYCISFLGLLIASPIFLVIGIIIKVTSPGSVFYTQSRMGRNGRTFNIIKFRTMCVDAESQTGPVWAKKNDARITSFGRFLRKTHMDELPQLINVLKGDMSIIGPRPERPFFSEIFKDEIDGYTRRLSVKPGITGLAQCYHRYDETIRDVKKKLRYDILYIERMCWMLDMKIIWKTVNVSLLGVKTS